MTIKFKEIILKEKNYSAEDVIEIMELVEMAVRDGCYINKKIQLNKQSKLS